MAADAGEELGAGETAGPEWESRIAGIQAGTATMTTGGPIGGTRIVTTKDVGA